MFEKIKLPEREIRKENRQQRSGEAEPGNEPKRYDNYPIGDPHSLVMEAVCRSRLAHTAFDILSDDGKRVFCTRVAWDSFA